VRSDRRPPSGNDVCNAGSIPGAGVLTQTGDDLRDGFGVRISVSSKVLVVCCETSTRLLKRGSFLNGRQLQKRFTMLRIRGRRNYGQHDVLDSELLLEATSTYLLHDTSNARCLRVACGVE
jgi:hypothetical protein